MPRLICLTTCALAFVTAAPALAQSPASLFDRYDLDSDGLVTTAEVQTWRGRFFERADANSDGQLTRAELDEVQADMQERRDQAGRGGQGRRRGAPQGDPIARFDANGDGQVSRAEFVDAPFEAIERFDANGDGALSRDELPRRRRGRG